MIEVKARAKELYAQMGPECFRAAYQSGKSLSRWLEEEDPSSEYKDGLTSFERQLAIAGIVTRSIPSEGIWSDKGEKFVSSKQNRALFTEWIANTYRKAAYGYDPNVQNRSLYLSGDQPPGSVIRPYVDAARVRFKLLAPAVPLSELVAITTPIDSDAYRAAYLVDDTDSERLKRVAEGTEVPRAILRTSDHAVRLLKYGRALQISYEQIRRARIDMIALHIARMAIITEVDKVAAAIGVMVNGDGNSNTAATNFNLTTLDTSATAGTLTLRSWLSFKLKFLNPYMCTTILSQEAGILSLLMLPAGAANNISLYALLSGGNAFGGLVPMYDALRDGVRYGNTPDAPANIIVGFDNRLALEMVTEIGSNITEVDKFVLEQTQALVMTEVMGFAIFDQFATKTFTVNA